MLLDLRFFMEYSLKQESFLRVNFSQSQQSFFWLVCPQFCATTMKDDVHPSGKLVLWRATPLRQHRKDSSVTAETDTEDQAYSSELSNSG